MVGRPLCVSWYFVEYFVPLAVKLTLQLMFNPIGNCSLWDITTWRMPHSVYPVSTLSEWGPLDCKITSPLAGRDVGVQRLQLRPVGLRAVCPGRQRHGPQQAAAQVLGGQAGRRERDWCDVVATMNMKNTVRPGCRVHDFVSYELWCKDSPLIGSIFIEQHDLRSGLHCTGWPVRLFLMFVLLTSKQILCFSKWSYC